MDTILIVTIAGIAGALVAAATAHSRYLQARLKHVRSRNALHYRTRDRSAH